MTALYNKREVFQFTPLREGRPCRTRHPRLVSISIHAPPRGATKIVETVCMLPIISIHAPPRGATREKRQSTEKTTYFNSRPSARGDHPEHLHSAGRFDFNSRPSARGDAKRDGEKKEHIVFQFTPLREGRRKGEHGIVGCLISIHAPPRGATDVEYVNYWQIIFQFTPLREGRRAARMICGAMLCIFQFTPLREGRRETG